MMRQDRFTEGASVILSGDRARAGTSDCREGIWGGASRRARRVVAAPPKIPRFARNDRLETEVTQS